MIMSPTMRSVWSWMRRRVLILLMLYSEGRPGVFAATVHILPGTHHVRFLVDGIMQTSPDLPTTVDFGNNLVNYIEVSADDLPSARKAAATASSGVKPEQAVPKSASQTDEASKSQPRGRTVPSTSQYFHNVPQYLIDFDQPEESTAYQYAIQAIDKLPQPPSLPGFLAKPILNAGVLMKDDNSVLNMPNHTVLNHLATSSIKNNILAVSATTRYKSKVSAVALPCLALTYPAQRPFFADRPPLAVRDDHHLQADDDGRLGRRRC